MNAAKSLLVIASVTMALLLTACAAVPGSSPGASIAALPSGNPTHGPSNPPQTPPTNPPGTPAPSNPPVPNGQVTSAAQAAALVFASDPRFSSMTPLRGDVVGQSAWYEAFDIGDSYGVSITLGSGDCQAGCINKHIWNYRVGRDGTIELTGEQGDDVEFGGEHGTSDPATVTVRLLAGPVCPVEQNPPDPNCAARGVANAEVILRDPSGAEVARATSDEDGVVAFQVPGGAYYVEGQEVEGYMGQAQPVAFSVVGGSNVGVTLDYDTGIR